MCWSGEKSYPNGASAMREARKLKQWNRGGHALRPYHCPECGGFHLANSLNWRARNVHARNWRESRSKMRLAEAQDA